MSQASHASSSSETPAALVAERRAGWIEFTRLTKITCIAVAVTLLFLLLVFRIL